MESVESEIFGHIKLSYAAHLRSEPNLLQAVEPIGLQQKSYLNLRSSQ